MANPYNFQGGNDAWWQNLIMGKSQPGKPGIPSSTPNPNAWAQYGQGLQSAVGSILGGAYNPGGGGGGGGGNPAAGILADYLSKMRADANANSISDAATRDAAIKRLAISFGQVPDFSSMGLDANTSKIIMNALDQKTRDLAAQNTAQGTSVYARMAHDNMLANRRIPAALAGRGLLRSGQTVSDLAEQAQGYKNQSFDAMNEMLNQATGAISQYAAAERARQEQLAQMELQAALAAAQEGYGSGGGGDGSGAGAPPPGANPATHPNPALFSFLNAQRKRVYGTTLRPWSGTTGGGV